MDKKAIIAALNANKTTREGARLSAKKVYAIKLDGDLTVKLAPQALELLKILFGEKQESWNEVELNALIMTHTEISKKQSPWLVFKFYRKQLIEAGFISVKE